MGLIIDTSALVALERCGGGARDLLAQFSKESVALPSIVWAELLVGVRLAKDAQTAARRRAHLEQIRLYVPLIDFNDAVAEHYADIFAECMQAGTPIPQNDTAVAATARHLDYRVLVGPADEAHFRRIKGLEVVPLSA